MKSNMITIIKKEFARFFLDRRMVINTLLLPGLIIYIMYSFMGQGFLSKMSDPEKENLKVYIVDMPESLSANINELPIEIKAMDKDLESVKKRIQEKEEDLLVIFPKNFDKEVEDYDIANTTIKAPEVKIYYNSTSMKSSKGFSLFQDLLNKHENAMSNKFDVNGGEDSYDMATKEDNTAQVFSSMLPMLMIIFLFSGCLGIVPEAIAGEKERGTISTLLVTPMKRSHLALGKIISLGVISLLSGISSFLGTILSMPKLMGNNMDKVNASVYGIKDYAMILLIIMVTVLVISAAISIISAFARSVKEASTAVMPLMVLVLVVGVSAMFGDGAPKNLALYCIPLYNSVQCMNGIFGFDYQMTQIMITVVVNLLFTGIMTYVLTKLFNNEKVMFSK